MSASQSSPIAIFDSGIGGLNVLYEAVHQIGGDYIYYADTEHVPYGEKSREEVDKFIGEAVAFLAKKNIKALVLACNTATSISVAKLREIYNFPIIGMEPAVKPAVERNKGGRVLVLATPLTLREQKFKDLVDRLDNEKVVDIIALPELVTLAEEYRFLDGDKIFEVFHRKFSKINSLHYSTVVLGCTHFPYFRKEFESYFPTSDIIDGTEGTVKHLRNILESKNLLPKNKKGTITYYESGKLVDDVWRFNKYLAYIKSEKTEDLLGN